MANTEKGPITKFLNKLHNYWGLTPNYPRLWAVSFSEPTSKAGSGSTISDRISTVLNSFGDFQNLSSYMTSTGTLYSQLLSQDERIHITTSQVKHFIPVTRVSIPDETNDSAIARPGGDGFGGARFNRVIHGHANTKRVVRISFIDTYREFYDCIIRPWVVALSHRGTVETSQFPSLKCNIQAAFFAKSSADSDGTATNTMSITSYEPGSSGTAAINDVNSSNQTLKYVQKTRTYNTISEYNSNGPALRKVITFHNCTPIGVPGKSYNYSSDIDTSQIITDIDFEYEYYTIEDKSLMGTKVVTKEKTEVVTTEGTRNEVKQTVSGSTIEDKNSYSSGSALT